MMLVRHVRHAIHQWQAHSIKALGMLGLFALLLGTPGCGPDFQIRIASPAERIPAPEFTITRLRGRGYNGVGYHAIWVSALDPNDPGGWSTRITGLPGGSSHVVYGVDPGDTFETEGLEPLEPGVAYRFQVRGAGEEIGILDFRVDADGVLHPLW